MKLRDGPDILMAPLVGAVTGFAAYVFLGSTHPLPENPLSGLAYVLFAGVWILASVWCWKRVFVWRRVEITQERVSEERFFAFWRIQTRVVRLDAKHFVDFVDFISSGLFCGARGGARAMTSCFFAGPGCRISVDVLRDEAQEIKGITTRGLSQ
jgi:hypothetical protein